MLEDRPWATVALDVLHTKMPEAHGYHFLLIALCPFCRWPIGIPLKCKDHEVIADRLFEKVFSVHGCRKVILNDNDKAFMRPVLQILLNKLNIRHKSISVRHPQGNSHCERIMRFLNSSFTILLPRYTEWPRLVERILFVYRTVPHDTYGLSPFYLLYGRHPILPIELSLGTGAGAPLNAPPDAEEAEDVRWNHTQHLLSTLQRTYEYVRYVQKKAAEVNKARRDNAGRRYAVSYDSDDFVLLWDPGDANSVYSSQRNPVVDRAAGLTHKQKNEVNQGFKFKWSGPHRVIKRIQSNVYLIYHSVRKREERINVDSLTPWDPFSDIPDTSTLLPPQWIPEFDKFPSAVPQPGFPHTGDLCVIWQPWGAGPQGSYTVVRFLRMRQYGDLSVHGKVEHHMECQWYGHEATDSKALRYRQWLPGWMSTRTGGLDTCYWRETPAQHYPAAPCTNWFGGEFGLGTQISPHHVVAFGFKLRATPTKPHTVVSRAKDQDYGYLTEDTLEMVRRHQELPPSEKGDPGPEHTSPPDADGDMGEDPAPADSKAVGTPAKIKVRNVTRKRHKRGLSMRLRKRSKGYKPVQMHTLSKGRSC